MRFSIILAVVSVLAGCAGVQPGLPPVAGPADLPAGPGLFSGASGDFLLVGNEPAGEEPAE